MSGQRGKISHVVVIRLWLNRRSKRLRKLLNFLTLMAQVLNQSCFWFNKSIHTFLRVMLSLILSGTIDAKELNVAMRYSSFWTWWFNDPQFTTQILILFTITGLRVLRWQKRYLAGFYLLLITITSIMFLGILLVIWWKTNIDNIVIFNLDANFLSKSWTNSRSWLKPSFLGYQKFTSSCFIWHPFVILDSYFTWIFLSASLFVYSW